MKNQCASCIGLNPTKIIKTDNNYVPEWLEEEDYVSNFIKSKNDDIKIYKQKKTDTKLELHVGKSFANRYILYWGAMPSTQIKINDAKKAYSKFENYGISKVDKNGDTILYFNCPQVYKTKEKNKNHKETFYRHIHFSFSSKSNSRWLSTVYSKIVLCDLTLEETLKQNNSNSIILLNTLPASEYAKGQIPHSYNLFYKDIQKMTTNDLINWFRIVLKDNNPRLYDLILSNKLAYYELPLVVYCGNRNCNLSDKAAVELQKKGFVDVREYKGGMEEYRDSFF